MVYLKISSKVTQVWNNMIFLVDDSFKSAFSVCFELSKWVWLSIMIHQIADSPQFLVGIGRATALALARCGSEVTAVTRTKADLDSLVQEVMTPRSRSIVADLLFPSMHRFQASHSSAPQESLLLLYAL